MTLRELSKIILESNKIGLTFHTSPDGDAIGSTLGLLNGLKEIGKEVYIISREVIPDNLSFLPLGNEIDGETNEPIEGTDLVIVLDCGNVERICADLDRYEGAIMNIDHHISNDSYGKYNFIDSNAAATAEIVYLLLKEFKFEFSGKSGVLERIGSCLYTSLVTDTGAFRHSNVTKRTFDIAGDLINSGVRNDKIHNELFGNKPFNKVKLIGEALSDLKLLVDDKVSFISLSKETLESFGMSNIDTSDIINMALNIEGVEVAVVTKEVEDGVKASLRSKNDVDVRRIAEVFGGGGHVKASGLKVSGVSIEEANSQIIKEIEKEIIS
ncbi:bifunctional oligoribonuclease/PAP phosphatase NrnA [Clostridium sp. SHJSY1]|uniref:DHH family phosphoesterase n=1 Tax=Clostridium sp. SHJSY1 TaxID=2942483 RepID=UPI0028770CA4|nr:bifunctional oligoribonuclease/PAP phosphatase NrnA [Clostridium sp. SHJSY1]MDS0524885.1 bifunctional oligoribonuclease/PAP phosphatase NrnA [Clostridium sp. SHJSY1]